MLYKGDAGRSAAGPAVERLTPIVGTTSSLPGAWRASFGDRAAG